MPYGAEAVNEIGTSFLTVRSTDGPQRFFPVFNSNTVPVAKAGQPCAPRNAVITVEGGSIRYLLNGQQPNQSMGIPVVPPAAGLPAFIMLDNPIFDYSGFIRNMQFVVTTPGVVTINASWRD